MKRAAYLAVLLAGCLDVPSGPAVECVSDQDCDHDSGEVCAEGVCYGNPPMGSFAAVISPPATRKDLVPRELMMPAIGADGWIEDLTLDAPSVFSGRVEATCTPPAQCDRAAIGTTITITRGSSFQGGPGFTVTTESDATTTAQGPSFSIALPKTGAADEDYTVTVMPTGRGDEASSTGPTAAELYPPARFTLSAKDNTISRMIQLGGPDLATIDGTLLSALGVGLSHYRVVAMGRWEANAPATEVSTVDYTAADGRFHLILSAGLSGPVEIVAKPAPSGAAAPELHLPAVPSNTPTQETLREPADLGAPKTFTFPVRGVDGSGAIAGVAGARVRITAAIDSPTSGLASARFSAEATSDAAGNVQIELLDGAAITKVYKLEVVPPASSNMGVLFGVPLQLAPGVVPLLLPTRISLQGKVLDANGDPLKDVSVTARPSLRFTWSFPDDAQQVFVASIPAATALTPETGEFALWVDPTVDGLWGHYDLAFEPASKVRAPSWVDGDVEIPRDSTKTTVPLDEIRLPDAAAIRGTVVDQAGEVVEGAEVKIFRLSQSLGLCMEVSNAPASCPIPALLQGRGDSDQAGIVRMTLPR